MASGYRARDEYAVYGDGTDDFDFDFDPDSDFDWADTFLLLLSLCLS